MAKKGGLGRGLDSLIPTEVIQEQLKDNQNGQEVVPVPVKNVEPNPHQPRTEFDEESIARLADSLKAHGLIQPVVVTRLIDGYQLVAGERRLRAAKLLGWDTIEAIVRTQDEQSQAEAALVENIQRDDLSVLEIANAYVKLAEEFNMDINDIAKRAGRGESTVRNQIRLLSLPEEAKQALKNGDISEGHARQVLALKSKDQQLELLTLIQTRNWTVRQAEHFVKAYKQQGRTTTAIKRTVSETPFTKKLSKRLGLSVKQQPMAQGGRIVISYKTEEELKKIQDSLL